MPKVESPYPLFSLAAARVNAKLTQVEFAKRCGVSESTVVAWETGRRLPGLKKLPDIEEALGMSIDYIDFQV